MTAKGRMDVGCGTYSYEIEVPLPVSCKPGETPPVGFHCEANDANCRHAAVNPRSAFFAAAHQYCNGGYNWVSTPTYDNFQASEFFWFDTTTIDPATNLPAYCHGNVGTYSQWSPATQGLCKARGRPSTDYFLADSEISVQVSPSPDQTGCSPLKDHHLPTGDDCIRNFENVINRCKCFTLTSQFFPGKRC